MKTETYEIFNNGMKNNINTNWKNIDMEGKNCIPRTRKLVFLKKKSG